MSIPDLHTKTTKEVAGATTNARFRFQTNLAIVELCERYEDSDSEFTILIEHFDDLTIVEFDKKPSLTFIQIKAKNGGKWTIDSLIKCDAKGISPTSIVGKLYQSASAFPDDTKALTFMSNAPYSVKLSTGAKCSSEATEIEGSNFHAEEVTKVNAVLDPDFPRPRVPDCVAVLRLRKTALSPSDADTYVVGKLSKLVEGESGAYAPVTALYKTLYSDLLSKASRVESYSTTTELLEGKGLSRSDFIQLLQNARASGRFEPVKNLIIEDLKDLGYNTINRARIIAGCNKFMANRSRGELAETQIGDAARKALTDHAGISQNAQSILGAAQDLRSTVVFAHPFPEELLFTGCLVTVAESLSA